MYNKISDDDFKTLVINQCKRTVAANDMYLLPRTISLLATPYPAMKHIIDFIIDNNFNNLYESTLDEIIIERTYRDELFNHMIWKFVDSDKINEDCILSVMHIHKYMQSILMPMRVNNEFIKIIHEKYGVEFFNKNVKRFETIRQYCFAFGQYLSEEEKDTIFKRLRTKTRHKYIDDAIGLIDFSKEQKQKLQSILILNELTR